MNYKVIRNKNKELIFLPDIVNYGEAYASFVVVCESMPEEKAHELMLLREKTPQDKIFDLDMKLNPIYHERYSDEEKRKIQFDNAINFYNQELVVTNKFFQEYNFGLNGTQDDMNQVQAYLKEIRLTEKDYEKFDPDKHVIRPIILSQYD